jgi:hypothetical protein
VGEPWSSYMVRTRRGGQSRKQCRTSDQWQGKPGLLQQYLADELNRQRLAEAEHNRMGINARRQIGRARPG